MTRFSRPHSLVVLGALLLAAASPMLRAQSERDAPPPPEPDARAALGDSVRLWRAQRDSLLRRADSLIQELARVDSAAGVIVRFDTHWSLDTAVFRPMASYGQLLAVGLAANAVLGLDRDPCPTGARFCLHAAYLDRWNTPDKIDHAAVAYALTSFAMGLGVRPRWAALLTCAAGAGYELTQGYISGKDIGSDCASALIAAGSYRLFGRLR